MSPDLALALALADAADAISLGRFRASDLLVETKPDRTPVTEADRAVEEAIRERLAVEHPDDGMLGEEFGVTGSGSRRWIVDPIDGTRNYSRGIPIFSRRTTTWGSSGLLEETRRARRRNSGKPSGSSRAMRMRGRIWRFCFRGQAGSSRLGRSSKARFWTLSALG